MDCSTQASLSIANSGNLLKLMSIESVMPSNHLILCHPFSSCLQSFPASESFSSESVLRIRWPKHWSFSFSISPSNEHSELISFRIDWLLSLQSSDSQESSPTPQFKSINSSVLSYGFFSNQSWTITKLSTEELMLLNCGVGEDS